MGQPACERADCERVGGWPIKNCKPLPSKFRESFADATVERVVVDGHRAKISEDHNLTTAVTTISVP